MFEQLPPDYRKVAEVSSFAALIAFCITIAKTVISKNYGSWQSFLAEMSTSILVAVLIGLAIDQTAFSLVTKSAIIGFCSFIAGDILEVLKRLRESLLADPKTFIKELLDMWRGR